VSIVHKPILPEVVATFCRCSQCEGYR
jgi:hypothetical protein